MSGVRCGLEFHKIVGSFIACWFLQNKIAPAILSNISPAKYAALPPARKLMTDISVMATFHNTFAVVASCWLILQVKTSEDGTDVRVLYYDKSMHS